MFLSSTTEYALRAAVFLASIPGDAANSERIAERTKVPSGYISKVMRDLVVAGIVSSQRGPNGGFALARDASRISVLEVVDAVTPLRRIRACPLGNPEHLSLCPLHRRLDDAIATIQKAFADTSLADLLDAGTRRGEQCGGVAQGVTITASASPGPRRSRGSGSTARGRAR
ncbi:MAG: Rrf2 family transcriptional regulator [Phycisphaerae bacterium]|nr:Rrf2 family transcriptional regulator [Phycisphaerae bacterium]